MMATPSEGFDDDQMRSRYAERSTSTSLQGNDEETVASTNQGKEKAAAEESADPLYDILLRFAWTDPAYHSAGHQYTEFPATEGDYGGPDVLEYGKVAVLDRDGDRYKIVHYTSILKSGRPYRKSSMCIINQIAQLPRQRQGSVRILLHSYMYNEIHPTTLNYSLLAWLVKAFKATPTFYDSHFRDVHSHFTPCEQALPSRRRNFTFRTTHMRFSAEYDRDSQVRKSVVT